ncbi:MAG TPA: NAD(P)H-binding protein, partial [Gemmatimonadales bacterium]|nr:NAD(P)H-binding protein [Gemmatimonadales bacterium]
MKALVTGATGFVGSHLVEALVQHGAQVTALVRSPHKAEPLTRLGVRQVPGQLLDPDALRQAVAGQDRVFHVAGLVAARNEEEFLRANREGTARLVQAMAQAGRARLVLVSS